MDDFDGANSQVYSAESQSVKDTPSKAIPVKQDKNEEFIKKLVEEHECGICYELFHQPVQLAPCLHIFCGGCLSDWFKKQ